MGVERLKPHRNTSHAALFQIMFSISTKQTTEVQLPGLSASLMSSDQVQVKFDLMVDAIEQADGLKLSFR